MTTAPCDYFGRCGGCRMQDRAYEEQLQAKEARLHALLAASELADTLGWMTPVVAAPWSYRHRARLSIRYLPAQKKLLIGFRHRSRPGEIVDLEDCPILATPLRDLLQALHDCLGRLEKPCAIPQVELVGAENGHCFIVRHIESLSDCDCRVLNDFSELTGSHIFLQAKGLNSLRSLQDGHLFEPMYRLPDFNLVFRYPITQFAQINPAVNRLMVRAVIDCLDPQSEEPIADLFCGVGNFALAAARLGSNVSGWEWSQESVDCAQANAASNGLRERIQFFRDNLDSASQEKKQRLARFNKFVIDPPRSGAEALMHCLPNSGERLIIYVSCQPKTLARDARILVHEKGYQLINAGLIDMFPHTEHMEAIAVFEHT